MKKNKETSVKHKKIKKEKKAKPISESDLPKKIQKKNKRKKGAIKFLIVLLILIGLTIAAFFIGWIHPNLENNQLAIVTNKILKIKTLYKPDHFQWEWSALIPGNIRIDIYDLSNRRFNVQRSGTLPSGKLYGRYAALQGGNEDDFMYNIDFDIVYRLKKANIMKLINNNRILPIDRKELKLDGQSLKAKKKIKLAVKKKKSNKEKADANKDGVDVKEKVALPIETKSNEKNRAKANSVNNLFYQDFETSTRTLLYSYINSRSSEKDFVAKMGLDNRQMEEELKLLIEKKYTEIEIVAFIVNEINIPDYGLYSKIRELVMRDLENAKPSEIGNLMKESNQKFKSNQDKLKALQELGEVLSHYPILMEYLKTYSQSEKDLDLLNFIELF